MPITTPPLQSIFFIGIAGGSGAGKSTLAFNLQDMFPDQITIIHLDDYHRKRIDVPLFEGMTNWDHPDAVDFEKLKNDLSELSQGNDVVIRTKNERDNPTYYSKTGERKEIVVKSRPVIILEGYLSLHDKAVRDFLNYSIYLDIHHKTRMARRTKFIDDGYTDRVLVPMHEQFVEPTKRFADLILDASDLASNEVAQKVLEGLLKKFDALDIKKKNPKASE